jgi:hypothetical protein
MQIAPIRLDELNLAEILSDRSELPMAHVARSRLPVRPSSYQHAPADTHSPRDGNIHHPASLGVKVL